MKTLIELYDERPLENVLGADCFRPERVVYLCPTEDEQVRSAEKTLKDYFDYRETGVKAEFLYTSLFNTGKIMKRLESVLNTYPDCAIDITGGSDAALFAAGALCEKYNVPVFTYSRKRNRFYSIRGAEFADGITPDISYSIEDYFRMAGGSMKAGRANDSALENHEGQIDRFFSIYMANRRQWKSIITWFQNAAGSADNHKPAGTAGFSEEPPLKVSSPYFVKGDRGGKIAANEKVLRDFEKLGFIRDLEIVRDKTVTFSYADEDTRFWLRDIGSVLELYIWKCLRDSGCFGEVRCSTIVKWSGSESRDAVTNEIDVIGVSGVVPVFVSCKTCRIETYALNELAILRDQFGGEMAKAVIVTSQSCQPVTRHRASALGIGVLDCNDLKTKNLPERIREICGTA